MMTKTATRIFYVIPTLIFIINEGIRTYIRPIYGQKKYGLISEILGWLPNFLAGLGLMTLGITIVLLTQHITNQGISLKAKVILLVIISAVALTGLILHEISQKDTGLYYDSQDIFATIAGVVLGGILYFLVLLKPGIERNHHAN